MEDPEVQKQRQEIVNTHTVAELGEIHGFSDFPVPATIERLMDKSKRMQVKSLSIFLFIFLNSKLFQA